MANKSKQQKEKDVKEIEKNLEKILIELKENGKVEGDRKVSK